LTNAATKLADGNYDVEIEPSGAREIELLSAAFENMALRLREREELLHLAANRDSITGLRNTTSYVSWVAQFDKKIESGEADFGVVMLDLNDLKKTNDMYGHEMGNELITTSAKIIADVFKRSPVFRIGGDEFLVVLQNKDLENCDELLVLLDDKCQNTFVADMQEPIRIAIGFSRFERGKDLQFADVFKRADNAMYENKRHMKSDKSSRDII
jgi:diguanylate cyclase (GGDEF)-like protein